MENKSATMADVANVAEVSVSTVSRVVNGYEHVSPTVRAKVKEAMDVLGFVPNRQAQQLVRGRSEVVGLMVDTLGTEYISEIINGINEALLDVDNDLLLYTTQRQRMKADTYVRRIVNGIADGLIMVVPQVSESYLDIMYEASFPHVLVDIDASNGRSWSVGITNWQAAFDAVTYLLELNHRRIAIITDQLELSTSASRLAGYKAALEAYGIAYDPDLVKEDNYLFPAARKLTEQLLRMPDAPSAIFTTSDLAAIRVMETLRLHGLQIPRDMSLIGFDDIPTATTVYPRLTTIRHPLFEMGQEAVAALLRQIESSDISPNHIQLETELVIRESCMALSPLKA